MIITCPECATRYSAKDDAIGPNGRMVRCSNCKASWFVSHDADTLELLDNQKSDLDIVKNGIDPEEEVTTTESFVEAKPTVGAHVQIRDKADQKRRNRRLVGVSMIWIVTLGLLAIGLALAYVFRQTIVDRTPAAATLYNAVGIQVKVSGLDFEKPKTKNIIIDSEPVLVINGFIRNLSNENQLLPMVELSLHNTAGESVATWLVELDQRSLSAGDRVEYISQYPNPPLDASTLKYRFVNDTMDQSIGTPVGN